MKYVLGSDDGVGHSFVVGFGKNPPVQAHHRAASCPDPPALCSFDNFNSATANPHTLFGALVGGEIPYHAPVCVLSELLALGKRLERMPPPGTDAFLWVSCIRHIANFLPDGVGLGAATMLIGEGQLFNCVTKL